MLCETKCQLICVICKKKVACDIRSIIIQFYTDIQYLHRGIPQTAPHLLQEGLKSTEPQPLHLPVLVAAPAVEVLVHAAMVSSEELTKEGSMVAEEA